MSKTEFYVIRHGETDWNSKHRHQGHVDIPLNQKGHEQATSLPNIFNNLGITYLLSSDLSRATQTAQVLIDQFGLPIQTDPRFREAHMGDVEGLTYEEIKEKYGQELITNWRSTDPATMTTALPGGETKNQVVERATEALRHWAQKLDHQKIAVTTHGGLVRLLLTISRPENTTPIYVSNCSVYLIEYHHNDDKFWSPLENLNPIHVK